MKYTLPSGNAYVEMCSKDGAYNMCYDYPICEIEITNALKEALMELLKHQDAGHKL